MLRSRGLLALLPVLVLFVTSTAIIAQDRTAVERMEADLCGCMSAVDMKATDAGFQREVRHCLENAVVEHPAAMNLLLRDTPGHGPKGVVLGELLGDRLDRKCTAFRAIRDRLRRLNAQGTLLKSES